MGRSVAIRTDLFGVEGLWRLSRRERNRRAALRMPGITNAPSGVKCREAAAAAESKTGATARRTERPPDNERAALPPLLLRRIAQESEQPIASHLQAVITAVQISPPERPVAPAAAA